MSTLAFDSTLRMHEVTVRTHRGDVLTSSSLEAVLDFLTIDDDRERVVWSVGTFVAPIISLLSEEGIRKFIEDRRLKLGRYTLLYTKDRVFQVIRNDVFYAYSCVGQYYEDEDEPKELSVVAEKMDNVIGAVEALGIKPWRISSHVNLLQPLFDKLDLPNYEDIPRGVGRFSFGCCKKLWREAHKIGQFEETWDYDLSGAFSSSAMNLYDTRRGDWILTEGQMPPDAVYGFLDGEVIVNSDLAPIVYRDSLNNCLNPTEKWWTHLAQPLVDMLYGWRQGEYDVYEAWWWVPWEGRPKYKPLYGLINRLYDLRGKDALLDAIVKRAMAAMFYGRFLQQKADKGPGDYFFPPWAAMIEAEITAKLAEFIVRNKAVENVICVTVDGCLLDKEVKVPEKNGLGEWRFEGKSPALIMGTGTYFHGDKRPSGIRYAEAVEMIEKHPDDVEWSKKVKCKVGLGDALDDKGSLGKVVERPQGFGIKQVHDRNFERIPRVGGELLGEAYGSQAYTMKQLRRNRDSCKVGK